MSYAATNYAVVAEVVLEHEYYADGQCPDFAVEPSPETARLLLRLGLLSRSTPSKFAVLAPVSGPETSTPRLQAPPLNVSLEFHLRLRNEDFPFFTDLTRLTDLLSNPSAAVEKAPPGRPPTSPGVHGSQGALVASGLARDSVTPVSTSAAPLDATADTTILRRPLVLPTGRPRPFASVRVVLENVRPGTSSPARQSVRFAARQASWVYYCIMRAAGAPSIWDAADEVQFKIADLSDPFLLHLKREHPGLHCTCVVSEKPVACREQPRTLNLFLADSLVLAGLPNPSMRSLSRPDALVQILRYRTDPHANP